jgi:hypothetical protein
MQTKAVGSRLVGGVTAAALSLGSPLCASAQDAGAHEWDFGRDPARKLAIAAVSYENFGVAVRCLDGILSVVVSGLPEGRGVRTFRYQMGDQTETDSRWVAAGDGTTAFAVWPTRTAAGMAKGGRLSLGVRDGERMRRIAVDLPPSTGAVSQVFQACGRELTSETEANEPDRENLGGLRWRSTPEPSFPSRTVASQGLAAVRCKVDRGGRLEDCSVESEFPEGGGFGRAATLGAHRTGRVETDGQAGTMEGREIAFVVNYRMSSEPALPSMPSRLRPRAEREGSTSRSPSE